MSIELLDYSIENEGTTKAFALLSIRIDGIGPILWHLTPDKWDLAQRWATFSSGIGAPSDEYDLSQLSADDRSLLMGERHGTDEVIDLEERVSSALREHFNAICREINFLDALESERDEEFDSN